MSEWLPVLISNIVGASALALIATFVGWSGRRATLARWLWLAVFLKLVTPPIVSMPIQCPPAWTGQFNRFSTILNSPRIAVPNIPLHSQVASTSKVLPSEPIISEASTLQLQSNAHAVSLVEILLVVWCVGSCWLIMRGVWRYWRMVRLLKDQAQVDEVGTQQVRELLQRGERGFVPQVRLIRARISPMLFGVGSCTSIVCPRELWLSLDEPQRQAFLAHESAHYARRDHWVRWIEWLVTSIYWWLPLVYWARVQLERHEEVACDAAAIRLLERQSESRVRRSYAESLLSVVDFLSEAVAATPRLASRMQPTAALEERLHWIMKSDLDDTVPRLPFALASSLVGLALLVHPTFRPWSMAEGVGPFAAASATASKDKWQDESKESELPRERGLSATRTNDLPPAPRGWWNRSPDRVWADRELGQNQLRLLAEVGVGIGISRSGGNPATLDTRDVRGLAFVAGSDRLIVGRGNGELHLWDTASARSVSLIGKHASAVTSTCWSPTGGLVSSDQSGTIVRWDLQSGQMLASSNCEQAVSVVRWSSDGNELAVVTGNWSQPNMERRVLFFDGVSLKRQRWRLIPSETAVVHHDAQLGWLAIAWSGIVTQLNANRAVAAINKNEVTGVVLCAELMPELSIDSSRAPDETVGLLGVER